MIDGSGVCVVHNHYDRGSGDVTSVCVVQADDRIHVSDEFLRGDLRTEFVQVGEGLMVINGSNMTVRYKLDSLRPEGYWDARRIDKGGDPYPHMRCDFADEWRERHEDDDD